MTTLSLRAHPTASSALARSFTTLFFAFNRFLSRLGLAACAAILPLAAGCEQWSVHSLEELAVESLSKQESRQLADELAGISPDDRTPQGIEKAAAIFAKANPEAETSPLARSTQAALVARLFASNSAEPSAPWLTPQTAPELLAQLHEVFNQADQRLRSTNPDLMTVMVWGQTGTALRRTDEVHAMLERAKTDERLRELLRRDDPTRQSLYDLAASYRTDWWREVSGVVWRRHVPSPMEQFGDAVECVLIAPIIIILMIHWGLGGTVDL